MKHWYLWNLSLANNKLIGDDTDRIIRVNQHPENSKYRAVWKNKKRRGKKYETV